MHQWRVTWLGRLSFQAAILSTIAGLAGNVYARPPSTPPERFLEIEKLSAQARQVLFLLAYSMDPVCVEGNGQRSAGILAEYIPVKESSVNEMRRRNEAVRQAYGVKPGQSVYLVDQPLTPFGVAGIRAGDVEDNARLYAELYKAQSNAVEFESPGAIPAPQSAAKPQATSSPNRADPSPAQEPQRSERANSGIPINMMTLYRNGTAVQFMVLMVSTCNMYLSPLDSIYRYAESDNRQIFITAPMLQDLSQQELVVVLAHEAAHVALNLSKGRIYSRQFGKFIIGKLASIGENVETETGAASDSDLIQADRLAMRVATGLGVEPPVYVATIKKLVAARENWGRPDYARTRPLNAERQEALEKSERLWEISKRYVPPQGIPVEKVRAAYARASAVAKTPNVAFMAVPPPNQGEEEAKQPAFEAMEADAEVPAAAK